LGHRVASNGSSRFKLHLRPKTGSMSLFDGPAIPPLPVKQGVVQVLADYVRYLYDCSKLYIKETHANGPSLWQSVEKTIDYVFTHPNGWEGPQQAQMRQAAVLAGLISDDDKGHARISFVTEGEASLHFCIKSGLSAQAIQVRHPSFLYAGWAFALKRRPARRRYCDRRCWWRNYRYQLVSRPEWQIPRDSSGAVSVSHFDTATVASANPHCFPRCLPGFRFCDESCSGPSARYAVIIVHDRQWPRANNTFSRPITGHII
jgi:hypothetical protein